MLEVRGVQANEIEGLDPSAQEALASHHHDIEAIECQLTLIGEIVNDLADRVQRLETVGGKT